MGCKSSQSALGRFSHVGAVLSGSELLATVPEPVARHILAVPKLAIAELPFTMIGGASVEMLWPRALEDDDACALVREELGEVARALQSGAGARRSRKARAVRRRKSVGRSDASSAFRYPRQQ
jgi:hypothetical protein